MRPTDTPAFEAPYYESPQAESARLAEDAHARIYEDCEWCGIGSNHELGDVHYFIDAEAPDIRIYMHEGCRQAYDEENRPDTFAVLTPCFIESGYLHSVGSGDVQAIERVVGAIAADDIYTEGDFDRQVEVLAGAIMGRAMCSWESAHEAAERLLGAGWHTPRPFVGPTASHDVGGEPWRRDQQ
jgi:hypothetical protein